MFCPSGIFRSRRRWLGTCVLFVASAVLCAAPAEPMLNQHAPQFVRTDLQGQRVDLSAYKGHVVLLTFWATWCAPCQIEIPHFIQWQSHYGPQGLQIIGISMDDDSAPVLALAAKRKINYPILMGDEKLGHLYGILGLPVTFLIDRQGVIRQVFRGESKLTAMEQAITKSLARH